MDLIIKDSKFFIGQIVYDSFEYKGKIVYDPYRVRFIEIGEGNKIVSIGTKHMYINKSGQVNDWNEGKLKDFYSHNGELDNLVINLPEGAKFFK
jgi:hypothetical protein